MDLRDRILDSVADKKITAAIIADGDGILAGTGAVKDEAKALGLSIEHILEEGAHILKGDEIARFSGTPKQIVMAEEAVMGLMAKPSGIATAANRFVAAGKGRPKVVCGAWKKMPPPLKEMIRGAVVAGGAFYRISRKPFVYLDKNYVKILGGVKESLEALQDLNGHVKVVQLNDSEKDIADEACEAVRSGAHTLFVDTGRKQDVKRVVEKLRDSGLRGRVEIAFGGGIVLDDMNALRDLDIDIVDIGRQIVDAPLLDMRMEVLTS